MKWKTLLMIIFWVIKAKKRNFTLEIKILNLLLKISKVKMIITMEIVYMKKYKLMMNNKKIN